jgi:hypothetical protein
MTKLGKILPLAAICSVKSLRPSEEPPNKIEEICAWLDANGACLNEWRESAGRSGANMALKFVWSWYETLDLDALATMRSGAKVLVDLDAHKKHMDRACTIAQYALVHKCIEDPFTEADIEEEGEESEEDDEDYNEADDNEDEVDNEIEAVEHPSKKLKSPKPTSEDPATKSTAP